jgi:hypothetical protein
MGTQPCIHQGSNQRHDASKRPKQHNGPGILNCLQLESKAGKYPSPNHVGDDDTGCGFPGYFFACRIQTKSSNDFQIYTLFLNYRYSSCNS